MWRSLLFIPVLEERFVARAAERGAGALVLDLEASIAPDRKDEARRALPLVVERLSPLAKVTVRINPLWLDAIRDLEACVMPGVTALHLARCETPEQVRAIDGIVTELEAERGLAAGSIRFVPMLETAGAVGNARRIAEASERNAGLTLGVEDYATSMGAEATTDLLRPAAYQVIQAARGVNLFPFVVPASMADFQDLEALESAARFARSLGSAGGYAVHPAQVGVLNQVFAPTDAELDWAKRILVAAEEAAKSGNGVCVVDGQMIDLPLITRAEQTIRNAEPPSPLS